MVTVKTKYFQTTISIGTQNVVVDACIIIKCDNQKGNIPILIIRCLDVVAVISLTMKAANNEQLILAYRDFNKAGVDAGKMSYKKFMYFIGKTTQMANFTSKFFDCQEEDLHMKNVMPAGDVVKWRYYLLLDIAEQVISNDVAMYLLKMTE